jgi:hypothetical protein
MEKILVDVLKDHQPSGETAIYLRQERDRTAVNVFSIFEKKALAGVRLSEVFDFRPEIWSANAEELCQGGSTFTQVSQSTTGEIHPAGEQNPSVLPDHQSAAFWHVG